ncbi:MAG: hypothetical protein PWP09_623, partial [Thermotogota bacterium]|nr:hypothetical protein [Thermotogota bacterium]
MFDLSNDGCKNSSNLISRTR